VQAPRMFRLVPLIIVALLAALGACSEDRARIAPPATDAVAPAPIGDLAIGEVTPSSVTLGWTAPGDDGDAGTATGYDIRYSTAVLTEAGFASAPPVSGAPAPGVAGTAQSCTVTGLSAGTVYYFALKTADEVPNWSGLSNVRGAATVANAAPVIEALTVSATAAAPGDTVAVQCEAHDANADSVAYAWHATAGTIEGAGARVRWIAPAVEGIHHLSVMVSDRWEATAADSLTLASDAFDGTLLVQTRDGIVAADPYGNHALFYVGGRGVEVLGERIFVTGTSGITEVDHEGRDLAVVSSSPRVSGHVMLLRTWGSPW
jgi:hypothetical protein